MLRSTKTLDRIYIQFAENGNIRKWQRDPFEGGAPYLASLPSDDEVGRPERVEAAFAVWRERKETGPNATALFDYIEDLEALLQSQAAELAAANERVTAAVDDYNDVLARAERAEAALAEKDKALAEKDAALVWYENNVAGCRLIHSGGDAHRNALAEDGGRRAKEALARRAHSKDGGERNG